eukprot:COSAG02_NODE_2159_length_9628_cov_7.080596_2_plen_151_part_00
MREDWKRHVLISTALCIDHPRECAWAVGCSDCVHDEAVDFPRLDPAVSRHLAGPHVELAGHVVEGDGAAPRGRVATVVLGPQARRAAGRQQAQAAAARAVPRSIAVTGPLLTGSVVAAACVARAARCACYSDRSGHDGCSRYQQCTVHRR